MPSPSAQFRKTKKISNNWIINRNLVATFNKTEVLERFQQQKDNEIMISLQNLEGAVPNKPDNSNTNFFNRLRKFVV